MATIREYFDTDARVLTWHGSWSVPTSTGAGFAEIIAKVAYDFEGNSKYWYIYIPATVDLPRCLEALYALSELRDCRLTGDSDAVQVQTGQMGYSELQSSQTLVFTKRIQLYLDFTLNENSRALLVKDALTHGYFLSIRDCDYARTRSENEKPLAFISHDSRDKDLFVRELAHELSKNFCTVWYDEFSLKVGDSLRASIESGLQEAKKCVVVLSPNFLANDGWGKTEFDSVFTREILKRENVILPVWLNVGVHDVYNYRPSLADKIGISANLGAPEVARLLATAIKKN